jgi:hypothetical protein
MANIECMAELAVSLCESVWAVYSTAPFHVRLLDPGEEQCFTGGLTLLALCGADIAWDIDVATTVEQILQPESIACAKCVEALRVIVHDAHRVT